MIDWDEDVVDLRSDTVTRPTAAMRKAMAEARVGDDVLGDDPTVAELEALAARTLGKEAALFVPSGTMGNQICVLTHTGRRGEVLLERDCHIYNHESGAFAVLSGVSVRPIAAERGVLTADDVAANVREADIHLPQTSLVAIENTHGDHSGTFWTPEEVQAVADAAHDRALPLHCDGARLFNSAAAQRVPAKELVAGCDSVMFCVSKGLSAPVGSLVVGPQDFVEEARWARKVFGGGMRQVGVLAAAGILSLREMTGRLGEDHAHARRLAEGLAAMDGYAVDPDRCPTNIVILDTKATGRTADEVVAAVGNEGVKVLAMGPHRVRAVTHRHVTSEDVERALAAFGKVAH